MSLSQVVHSMRRRIPWEVGKTIIKEIGLSTGRGWDKTAHKLLEDHLVASKETPLRLALEEHILCGEKSVRFYQLENDDMDLIRQFSKSCEVEKSPFSEYFPNLVPEDDLSALRPLGINVVAVRNYPDASAIILGSVRSVQHRQLLTSDDFPDATETI